MLTVTGSPLLPFADAVLGRLTPDATLIALMPNGIKTALPRGARVLYPYGLIGREQLNDRAFAMQLEGGEGALFIDVWSDKNGPGEAQQILSRIRALLQRQTLTMAGFTMIAGSLTCRDEQVFREFDADMPERTLYHGIQEWVADLEEAI